jgi:hypothetical protein
VNLRSGVFLSAALFLSACAGRDSSLPVANTTMTQQARFDTIKSIARSRPVSGLPTLGAKMVDYRAVDLPTDLAVWSRQRFQLAPVGREISSSKKAVATFAFLEAVRGRGTSSARHTASAGTCYYELTWISYDDGATSTLTNVDLIGCDPSTDVGTDPAGQPDPMNGVGGAPGGAIPGVNSPTHPGCGDLKRTAASAVLNMITANPALINSTANNEAYSYIFTDGLGNYLFDAVQQTVANGANGEAGTGPPRQYDGYTLVGIAHTHPQQFSGIQQPDSTTAGTHFSPADFSKATSFDPPIAMFVGISTAMANVMFELNYFQSGTDSAGNPIYSVPQGVGQGEVAMGFIGAAACP